MRARTSRTILLWLAVVFLGGMLLLSGEVREGDTVVADAGADGLTLRVKEREEAAAGAE